MNIKAVTLCSGYDSQCLALERLKNKQPHFGYELIAWSEFDPEIKTPLNKQPAVIAHNALFPQWADRNLGDMTKIDWNTVPDFDLLTYSTPCQSISNAGLQHGFAEGSGTRSSIIWNVRDAVRIKRPKYLLLENVKAMVEGKFLPMFNLWQAELSRLGYINFAKVLNAKDYGVPQNRERIFLLSIRDDGDSPTYHFPKPFKLDKRLKDVLEQYVDEKYYLSDKLIKSLSRDNGGYKAMKPSEPPYEGTASCLTARMWKMGRSDNYIAVKQVGNIVDDSDIGFKNPQRGRVYSVDGLSPCLNCCEGGGLEPKVIIEGNYTPSNNNASKIIQSRYRIRKLTPREAFRLMGVDDNDIDAIQATGISNSSQYKLAGNSIVVDVLYHIFRKAFIEKETESQQLTLF